jgi:hypothetical protein
MIFLRLRASEILLQEGGFFQAGNKENSQQNQLVTGSEVVQH